jgi:hypothetical protein
MLMGDVRCVYVRMTRCVVVSVACLTFVCDVRALCVRVCVFVCVRVRILVMMMTTQRV